MIFFDVDWFLLWSYDDIARYFYCIFYFCCFGMNGIGYFNVITYSLAKLYLGKFSLDTNVLIFLLELILLISNELEIDFIVFYLLLEFIYL
jgi:hypothetical protein